MIFHDLKLIFMHVERTGGVAFRKYLLNYEKNFERLGKTKHYTIEEAKKLIDPKIWDSYLKVGFVRNPYDRLVSWYFACKKNKQWDSPLALHAQNCNSFEELIKNPHPKMLISQKDKVKGCDFICYYEAYKKEVEMICGYLGIPYINYKANSSDHKHYSYYYSEEMKEIVTEMYKEDLEEFGYEF